MQIRLATTHETSVLLSEDFSGDPKRGKIPLITTGLGRDTQEWVDGELRLRAYSTNANLVNIPLLAKDLVIAFDVRVTGDQNVENVSVTCRSTANPFGGYRLNVAPVSFSASLQRFGGPATPGSIPNPTLVPSQQSQAIRGKNLVNHIELSCVGDQITGSVNGVTVATASDNVVTGPGTAQIGLSGASAAGAPAAEAAFDNVVVSSPKAH
ncbi:MAG: hypothetical protein WCL53_05075 [Chloroflexota bacterium]